MVIVSGAFHSLSHTCTVSVALRAPCRVGMLQGKYTDRCRMLPSRVARELTKVMPESLINASRLSFFTFKWALRFNYFLSCFNCVIDINYAKASMTAN